MPSPRLAAAIAVTVSTLLPAAAWAEDFAVGFAAGPAQARVTCVDAYPCDRSGAFWKLSGAWRFAPPFDVQLAAFGARRYEGGDRTDLGTPFGGTFRVTGIGITAGYGWSFAPGWTLAGRLGAASVRTTFDYAAPFEGRRSMTRLQPLAGVGLAYAISPSVQVGLDYDETRLKAHTHRGPLRMVGAAAQFNF